MSVELKSENETKDGTGHEDVDESPLVLKLLVDSSQLLCLYKTDGTAIEEMSTISGAQIQILPRDDLPSCALPSDEVVQGGTGIKSIKQETGSEITIMDGVPDSEEWIIVVSGPALKSTFQHPVDRISPVQDVLVRVHKRILGAFPNSKEGGAPARMLVSSNQIGCLLGVGGAVITEMRKSSRAYIRIVGRDQVPKCAMQNEEVVQINGNNNEVQDALLQITFRPRHHYFRNAFSPADHPNNPHFSDHVPPFPSYAGRRDMSPPEYILLLVPQHTSSMWLMVPMGFVQHLYDGPFMQSTFRPSLSRHLPEGGPWNQFSDARITICELKPGEKDTAIIISGTPEQTQGAQSLIQAFVMIEQESN